MVDVKPMKWRHKLRYSGYIILPCGINCSAYFSLIYYWFLSFITSNITSVFSKHGVWRGLLLPHKWIERLFSIVIRLNKTIVENDAIEVQKTCTKTNIVSETKLPHDSFIHKDWEWATKCVWKRNRENENGSFLHWALLHWYLS